MDKILQAYNLDSEFPTDWGKQERLDTAGLGPASEATSKYALTHQLMSSLNTSRTASDERDPLGSTNSVMSVLRDRGIDVDSDPVTRAKYMLSSPKFNARLFLRHVHGSTSFEELKKAQNVLQSTISRQRDDLRHVVDDDYEQFVTAKRHLDEVMGQLGLSGVGEQQGSVAELQKGLEEATNKVTLLSRPLEELGLQRARLGTSLKLIKENKYLFDLPSMLQKHVDNNEHHDFMRDYRRGTDEVSELLTPQSPPSAQKLGELVSLEISKVVDGYRNTLWEQLLATSVEKNYSRYFGMLVDLGVEGNPILDWVYHKAQELLTKINKHFDKLEELTLISQKRAPSVVSDHDVARWIHKVARSQKPNKVRKITADLPLFVDSPQISEIWAQISGSFNEFSGIVSEAIIFWREVSILLSGKKTGAELKFTGNQERSIREKFVDIISTMARRLLGWLEMPLATNVASKFESETNSLAFIPMDANSFSTARYLVRITEILNVVDKELADLVGPSNEYAAALQKTKVSFAGAISKAWIQDSMRLGSIQNWDSGSLKGLRGVADIYGVYHSWILWHLSELKDSDGLVGRLVQTRLTSALSLSVQSLHKSLADNEIAALNSDQPEDLLALYPFPLSQDSKLLVAVNTFSRLEQDVVPEIYAEVRRSLHLSDTQESEISVIDTLKEVHNKLFELYVRKKKSMISKTISEEITASFEKFLKPSNPTAISNFILESLMILVEVHAKFSEFNASMLPLILSTLYQQLLASFLHGLRELDRLGRLGVLQFVADVEFLRSVLHNLRSSTTQKLVQQIYDTLRELAMDTSIMSSADPREQVTELVQAALNQESLAFVCFSSVTLR